MVFKQIADRFIERGESRTIRLYLNGKSYEAKLNNNNIDKKFGGHADIVQVRYGKNSEIVAELRGFFNRSFCCMKSITNIEKSEKISQIEKINHFNPGFSSRKNYRDCCRLSVETIYN